MAEVEYIDATAPVQLLRKARKGGRTGGEPVQLKGANSYFESKTCILLNPTLMDVNFKGLGGWKIREITYKGSNEYVEFELVVQPQLPAPVR